MLYRTFAMEFVAFQLDHDRYFRTFEYYSTIVEFFLKLERDHRHMP